ncbi:MAG TPA: glycerophosphodiester phosphodiesterase family protein [Gammaproteobacteria bacterium]|nr:glycerophosphodiester phosphodiesterase family protein [Gammaproteobacteria bacterium]
MPHRISPVLVAHRGYPSRYPENTLPGIEAAVLAGARFVEFDIQMSRDGVPVLCHDANLKRTADVDRLVMELSAADLDHVDVCESGRFGSRFKNTFVPRLSEVMGAIENHAGVQAFVEIKLESLQRFGRRQVMEPVMAALKHHLSTGIVISFDAECLLEAKRLGAGRIGFVTEDTSLHTLHALNGLQPDFLFTSQHCFSELRAMFDGPWRWAVYHTEDPARARQLSEDGADLVETNAIGEMLAALSGRNHRDDPQAGL